MPFRRWRAQRTGPIKSRPGHATLLNKNNAVFLSVKARETPQQRLLVLRGTILNRTYGVHKILCMSLFIRTIFGPIYYGPPQYLSMSTAQTSALAFLQHNKKKVQNKRPMYSQVFLLLPLPSSPPPTPLLRDNFNGSTAVPFWGQFTYN